MGDAARFMRDHRAALAPWALAIIAAGWVADISAVLERAGAGARAFKPEPFTSGMAARALGWAANSAVQTGQGINPPWELVPQMTNPFILLAVAYALEISAAVLSAYLIHGYLVRAARPLKSAKWLASAPSAVFVLTLILLWFRSYGPLSDMTAIIIGKFPPEAVIAAWQVFSWFIFVPFMLTAYLMILGRLESRSAAAAARRLLRENWRSAAPLIGVGFIFFLVQTLAVRVLPGTGPVSAASLAMAATAVRVGLGFWIVTAWLLWADARYGGKVIRTP